jgi:hypothetical protein
MRSKDQILLESIYDSILLMEKGSPILFHYTDIPSALNMVNSGKINLTYASGSDRRDSSKGKAYYFSMSRIRHSGYNHGSPRDAVIFEFDGTKLGSKYQIRPFDYWGYSWDLQRTSPIADEQEDRLFSHDQQILLYPYLKSINIYVKPSNHQNFSEDQLKRAKFIKKKAEENNIPCFIYNDLNAWRTNNRKKAVDFESSSEVADSDLVDNNRIRGGGKDIMTILKIINDPFNKQQDKDVKDFLYRYRGFDWKSSVSTMISNARTEKNPEVRNVLYELSKLERKNKKNVLNILDGVYDVIRSYEHIIQIKSAIDSFIYSITGEKPSGGIKKEQLKSYLERYSNKFEAKLVGERFVDLLNMAIVKLPQGTDDYSETLSYIQKAKQYLDSINMEERAYLVANQGNLYR